MPIQYLRLKKIGCFTASKRLTLLLIQALTFGIYNTRLKLKKDGYRFRQSDIVTILIAGELNESGCKVNDFCSVLGIANSVSRNILNRSTNRGLLYKVAGSKGRGYAAKYYLNDRGLAVYSSLKEEMGETFDYAKKELQRQIIVRLKIS